jgi:hypothetical protein
MPVLNLEKPGRFKKGGIAMKKPVAKRRAVRLPNLITIQMHNRLLETKGDEITRDNEDSPVNCKRSYEAVC